MLSPGTYDLKRISLQVSMSYPARRPCHVPRRSFLARQWRTEEGQGNLAAYLPSVMIYQWPRDGWRAGFDDGLSVGEWKRRTAHEFGLGLWLASIANAGWGRWMDRASYRLVVSVTMASGSVLEISAAPPLRRYKSPLRLLIHPRLSSFFSHYFFSLHCSHR